MASPREGLFIPSEREARTPEYWVAKAAEYRAVLEAKEHLLVTTPTTLMRAVVVRYKKFLQISGQSEEDVRVVWHTCLQNNAKLFAKGRLISMKRVWLVLENNDPLKELHRWDRLVMAQAQRDGRQFHYAKYIMQGGADGWNSELTTGTPSRRR